MTNLVLHWFPMLPEAFILVIVAFFVTPVVKRTFGNNKRAREEAKVAAMQRWNWLNK